MRAFADRLSRLSLLLCLFALAVAVAGCDGGSTTPDEDEEVPDDVELGTYTWTVNGGTRYTAEVFLGSPPLALRDGDSVTLAGYDAVGETLHSVLLGVAGITAPGTYTAGAGGANGVATYNEQPIAGGGITQYRVLSGWTFRVTGLTDAAVAGTFAFTAQPTSGGGASVDIEGAFNLAITE